MTHVVVKVREREEEIPITLRGGSLARKLNPLLHHVLYICDKGEDGENKEIRKEKKEKKVMEGHSHFLV